MLIKYVPCEVVDPSLNDQGKFPSRISSELVGGRASSLLTVFNASTDDTTSDFSFEHLSRIDDLLLLESEKSGTTI
jgi:hypothetical protein